MRYIYVSIFLIIFMSCSKAQIKDLHDFQWKNRLLIICTNSDTQSQIEHQLAEIEKAKKDFAERDLKVVILKNQKVEIWNSSASHQLAYGQIIQELNIRTEKSYQNLLIGKDGGVKLREDSPISNQKLFNTIDAMPMRQREMRDGN